MHKLDHYNHLLNDANVMEYFNTFEYELSDDATGLSCTTKINCLNSREGEKQKCGRKRFKKRRTNEEPQLVVQQFSKTQIRAFTPDQLF